jgi:hypothetical protein
MTPSSAEVIMAKTGFKRFLEVLMGLGALFTPAGAYVEAQAPALLIHVYDYARVPDTHWRLAKQEAEEVYSHIGVRLLWVRGKSGADAPENALHIDMVIMSQALAERQRRIRPQALGASDKPRLTAYIYYSRIADTAGYALVATGRLLGKIIAHEVGHLLLPQGHSKAGIMRDYLAPEPDTHERFDEAQAATIRERLDEAHR